MINTFPPYDLQEVKEKCASLIDLGTSFTVKHIVDIHNNPHHWEVEEKIYAPSTGSN